MSRPHIFTLFCALFSIPLLAQQAELSGIVRDASKAAVPGVSAELLAVDTNLQLTATTDESGHYRFASVAPGRYTLTVSASGFDRFSVTGLKLDVGAKAVYDVDLKVGAIGQTVTVDGSGIQINTVNANVSTLVDRQFVENIPLNGRSFQSLLTMAPGVLSVPSAGSNRGGEMSVNGQRTEANYFMVDGVSANTGAGVGVPGYGGGYSGSVAGQTILGTTQSLVSIDALQEFRATTSTYSSEYGRTPGGQFSFLTRSGTNEYQGTLFNYFRNDVLDSNNFFNNRAGLGKDRNRQNNFGGTLGGPVSIPGLYRGKDKTFFFVSYEGLRLRSPQAALITEVPSLAARQLASNDALRAVLNAFPRPNGGPTGTEGLAYFTSGYSSPSNLNTTSVRLDHRFNDRFSVFGRFSNSPSNSVTRQSYNLAQVTTLDSGIQTWTVGATNLFTPRVSNDFRFNYSKNTASSLHTIDNFGGATPMSPADYARFAPGTDTNSWLYWVLVFGQRPAIRFFPSQAEQRQFNITNSTTASIGSHALKFGIDFRRLINESPLAYTYQTAGYANLAELQNNAGYLVSVYRSGITMKPVYKNFSAYVQDEWRATPRLNLSLGLRWDVNPAPWDAGGNQPYGVTSTDLRTMKLAARERGLWATTWANFGPRMGAAYQLRRTQGTETVIRAGAGLFFDTGNTESARGYWYSTGISSRALFPGLAFPLTQAQLDSMPTPSTATPYMTQVIGYDPNLKLPYTWQWNLSVEQSLGQAQTLTVGYLGSAGRRLTTQRQYYPDRLGNTSFGPTFGVYMIENGSSSDYNSLQVKLQRKLAKGFQGLASYTWSHNIDDSTSNFLIYQLLRASSDYDIRHNLQVAATYDIPGTYRDGAAKLLLGGWAMDTRISWRTALPVDILGGTRVDAATGGNIQFHPDLVAGQSIYVNDANAPGGRRINFDAFATVPATRDGSAGRNVARAFGSSQLDLTIRKEFHLTERFRLQFRAEAFNLLNHANFGRIYNQLSDGRALFGTPANTLNGQLGGLNSLYQVGGPRSMQLALKVRF